MPPQIDAVTKCIFILNLQSTLWHTPLVGNFCPELLGVDSHACWLLFSKGQGS